MTTLLQLLGVITAQSVVYFIPPWITVRHIAPREPWAARLFWSAMLAISSQTILGFIWSLYVRKNSKIEVALWLTGWLIASTLLAFRAPPLPSTPARRFPAPSTLLLLAILAGALLTRCLHPLQTAALGQSDAYSHLQFIQAIISDAHLFNPMYPPGHALSMSLPAIIFNIDPYLIARFGGAVTGVLLVLGAYLFAFQLSRSKAAAFAAAFFIAFFPPLNLLAKTSVGLFASQLGLCYILVILVLYSRWALSNFQFNRQATLLSIAMAAMIITTPLMLIHLFMIMGITGIIICFCRSPRPHGHPCSPWTILRRATLMAMPALLAISLHLVKAQKANPASLVITQHELAPQKPAANKHRPATTHQAQNVRPAPPSPLLIVADFAKIKRTGYHNAFMDITTSAITIACAGLLFIGWRRRSIPVLVLGVWGTLTSIQALTGLFQFSLFQREGWSLLIATTILGGWTFGLAWPHLSDRPAAKWIIAAIMILSLAATCWRPPRHTDFVSSAESDIVDVIRKIVAHDGSMEGERPREPGSSLPIIATRKMAGFQKSTQGELVAAIADPMPTLAIDTSAPIAAQFSTTNAYLLLLERSAETNQSSAGSLTMNHINPDMARDFSKVLKREMKDIETIESFLNTEAPATWTLSRHAATKNLWQITLTPRQ